jgi:hypothetical protein
MMSLPRLRRWLAGLLCLAALPACSLLPHHKADDAAAHTGVGPESTAAKASAHGLAVEIKASPDPLKLGEARQIEVTFTLRNTTKESVDLRFPTSQIIEIVLREQASGKIVSQWSTDQTFQQNGRLLAINSHERVEYDEPITTRELHAGTTYTLEAWVIGYEQELHAARQIIPQP